MEISWRIFWVAERIPVLPIVRHPIFRPSIGRSVASVPPEAPGRLRHAQMPLAADDRSHAALTSELHTLESLLLLLEHIDGILHVGHEFLEQHSGVLVLATGEIADQKVGKEGVLGQTLLQNLVCLVFVFS